MTHKSSKVVPRGDLADLSQRLRGERKIIVFTNGCFDVLHVGHVQYLRDARALGDCLVVGVNSDDSVHRLKGDHRPFNPSQDRAEVLAALEDVDIVSIFDEDTAAEMVEQVRPDIYVKGGDYTTDPQSPKYPIEGDVVRAYGGSVRIIPFVSSYSTTGLIERIRSAGADG